MRLIDFLNKNREKIAGSWKEKELMIRMGNQVIQASNHGQFTNPVAYAIANSLDIILDSLLTNKPVEDQVLDDIIRIRAVQSMPPSQAVSFINKLKEIIRELANDKTLAGELLEFELKLDSLMARSFDIYQGCKEQLYNIKLKELEKGTFADVESGAGCPSALLDSMEGRPSFANNGNSNIKPTGGRQ